MNLKKHFVKRHIFAVMFLFFLYGFSILNFVVSKDELLATIKNSVWDFNHISENVTAIEDTIGEKVPGKMELIEIHGFIQELMSKKENNGFAFVKNSKGMLFHSDFENQIPYYLDNNIEQAKRISKLAEKYGSKTVALIYPDKCAESRTDVERGLPIQNFTPATDAWKKGLVNSGIPVIDFRQRLLQEGYTTDKLFYNTDHHWRVEAAYSAYRDLINQMNERFGANMIEHSNVDDFEVYQHDDIFLGSMGRETGIIYSGLDDFTVMYPKFDTEYVRKYYLAGELYTKEGKFEETILNPDYLNKNNVYENDIYSSYLDGVLIYDHIENKLCPQGPKILWIRDSYASPLAAFTSTSASVMDMVWSINYEDDIENLMKDNEYDYVFIALAGMNLPNEKLFAFME